VALPSASALEPEAYPPTPAMKRFADSLEPRRIPQMLREGTKRLMNMSNNLAQN
jgi:hypothetical protein